MEGPEIVRRSLDLLYQTGDVVEVRILNTKRGTVSGYFDDMGRLAEAAASWSGRAPAVYTTLNPVARDLLARAANRLREFARETTTDDQIVRRRWLPLDFDPVRPSGISATDVEKEAAFARARECLGFLDERGWPAPLFGDSGNGAHLLYPIDLENDEPSRDLARRVLAALAFRFDDHLVKLDQTTYNAARIWKLYGTMASKGDDVPERPHRLAELLTL